MAASKSADRIERAHPVPGTVEIESEHEIATSAAVPGTDMEIGTRVGGNCQLSTVNCQLSTFD